MKLQTQIPIKRQQPSIDYRSKVLLLGSCFVENIGEKLSYLKFQTQVNPFGILFHPKAIERLIDRITQQRFFAEEDVFEYQNRWQSLEVHSLYSDTDKQSLLLKLNESITREHKQIKQISHLVITLGTAWGYRHLESQKIVANCHKLPQRDFEKQLSSITEIQQSLQAIVTSVKNINPDVTFIFTVSPIRHLKDGFVENQRSKAHLIAAVHQLLTDFKDPCLTYFPSYELMMDELRDYRFYSADMIHLNPTAVAYVWERFSDVWLHPDTAEVIAMVEKIQNGLLHRPFNPKSNQYLEFQEKLQQKIAYLSSKYPHIQF